MKNKLRKARSASFILVLSVLLAACGNHAGSSPDKVAPVSSSSTLAAAPASANPTPEPVRAHFTITGQSLALKDGTKVTLLEQDAKPDQADSAVTLATATVRDGGFTLTGSVNQPMRGALVWGAHSSSDMIIENSPYQVVDTGVGLAVKGGHYNNLAFGYRSLPQYIAAKKHLLEVEHKAFDHLDMLDEAKVAAARKSTEPASAAARAIQNEYQSRIIEGDSPALLKLFVLSNNYDWKRYPPAQRVSMLATYEETLGPNPVVQRMHFIADLDKKTSATHKALAVGKPYRDIVAVDADGRSVKLSDVLAKNKLVLLDFWASWCGPCRGEFPHLAKTYQEFHKDGFEIYAVSLDDARGDWLKALREERANPGEHGIPWINLVDPGFEGKSAAAYGVLSLPTNYLIDSDGKIVGVNMRDWGVEKAVRKLLGTRDHAKR